MEQRDWRKRCSIAIAKWGLGEDGVRFGYSGGMGVHACRTGVCVCVGVSVTWRVAGRFAA
jgi:hypothetical protein